MIIEKYGASSGASANGSFMYVLARLREVSDQVVAEIADADPLAARIHASYTQYLRDVRRYHDISEKAYLEVR